MRDTDFENIKSIIAIKDDRIGDTIRHYSETTAEELEAVDDVEAHIRTLLQQQADAVATAYVEELEKTGEQSKPVDDPRSED